MSDGLLHVSRFVDRHRRERIYVRNPSAKKKKSIPLTAPTGTPEFTRQYTEAIKALGLSARSKATKRGPATKAVMVDYHGLLGRYMLHVLRCAGSDFTDHDLSAAGFSDGEIAALKRLSDKAGKA
jgi:hypothetical protein